MKNINGDKRFIMSNISNYEKDSSALKCHKSLKIQDIKNIKMMKRFITLNILKSDKDSLCKKYQIHGKIQVK